MNVLLVCAHPDPSSFSTAITQRIRDGLQSSGEPVHVEIADLHAENFDPRFTAGDLSAYKGLAKVPEEIAREQQRIDRADALVLVFPVYWWSMPALLKGWIDRVFSSGWAFDYTDGVLAPRLVDRPVHMVALAGTDEAGWRKHGYDSAMNTQLSSGIFEFCGIQDVRLWPLFEAESKDEAVRRKHLETAFELGRALREKDAQALVTG